MLASGLRTDLKSLDPTALSRAADRARNAMARIAQGTGVPGRAFSLQRVCAAVADVDG
jgi:hypothetical protein